MPHYTPHTHHPEETPERKGSSQTRQTLLARYTRNGLDFLPKICHRHKRYTIATDHTAISTARWFESAQVVTDAFKQKVTLAKPFWN